MKKIILILILLFSPSALYAFDGEVYFGKFWDSTLRANPDGGEAQYISGMELGHCISILRPYAKIETILDQFDASGLFFHPSSVIFDLGIRMNLKSVYFEISHMCWHPIDSAGKVEQYNLFKIGVKFGSRSK